MMEIASGLDWEALIQQEVFTPIRMNSATLGQVFDNVVPPKAPVGHDLSGGALVPRLLLPNNYEFHYKASAGAAGYVACTLQDWTKFLHVQATSSISDYLTPATGVRLQQSYTGAGTDGYGRGDHHLHKQRTALGGSRTGSCPRGRHLWGGHTSMDCAGARLCRGDVHQLQFHEPQYRSCLK